MKTLDVTMDYWRSFSTGAMVDLNGATYGVVLSVLRGDGTMRLYVEPA